MKPIPRCDVGHVGITRFSVPAPHQHLDLATAKDIMLLITVRHIVPVAASVTFDLQFALGYTPDPCPTPLPNKTEGSLLSCPHR
jgi:hypothetical protein